MDVREARCHLIAEVLSADGRMTDEERALLDIHVARAELSEEQSDRVRHFEGASGAALALRALPEEERRVIVDELVEAALADGKLTANETAAVKRIAALLGLE
jgi:uncharacterized tellurite resistance protein B-like protein